MTCPRALARFALAALLFAGGCATGGGARKSASPDEPAAGLPAADSVTVVLWHLDEPSGIRIANDGSRIFDGVAGRDTYHQLGRYGGARAMTRSVDSFVWLEARPELQITEDFTVEAWIRLDRYGSYEDTPIAARWNTSDAEQSWFFAIGGQNLNAALASPPGPGYHSNLTTQGLAGRSTGKLIFGFQPHGAGPAESFFSNQIIETGRWTHVAATFDGRVVRLYVNGLLDAQFAVADHIRPSTAPLVLGNLLDARDFTTFNGDLSIRSEADQNPYYAFEGAIDEFRISRSARTEFPGVR